MKPLLSILLLGLLNYVSAQTYPDFEKVLAKELSKDSTKDSRWVFYADQANVVKIEKPLVKARISNYDFFKVDLTNYLGYHVNKGTCLVLYDSLKAKILLVEPLWYNEISKPLIHLFIGEKFDSKNSLFKFLNELNELMEIGSGFRFVNTSFTEDTIHYDLVFFKGDSYTTGGTGTSSTVRYNEDGVLRKIRIEIKNLRIVRFSSRNPITNDEEIIQ